MWIPFKKENNQDSVEQAHLLVDKFTAQKMMLDLEKESLLKRQVELWSILTLSAELESEYRTVTKQIAFISVKIMCLQDHIRQLTVARYHCINGDGCSNLKQIIVVDDPCGGITEDLVSTMHVQKGHEGEDGNEGYQVSL